MASLVRRWSLGGVLAAVVPALALSAPDDFYSAMDASMAKMHADMHVAPSGDIDRDFARMMVPHHQGAIDMAVAVLRHGRNPQIRRLAQEIIVTQQQEIAAMRLALGQPLPPLAPSPTEPAPGSASHAHTHQ